MSDINNEVKFNIKNRTFNWNKKDYKDNKKEEALFHILTDKYFKDSFDLSLLDKGDNELNVITLKDIQQFLTNKDVQKKNITEEDVINFLNKMIKLNPTKEEKTMDYVESHYKDENGNPVMTDELKEMFGLEHQYNDVKDMTDSNKNVKSGLEVFDLNGDGKLDNLENQYIFESGLTYSNIDDLNNYLSRLEDSSNGDKSGVISSDKKQQIYNQLSDNQKQKMRDEFNNSKIKAENNNLVVNDSVKQLFKDTDKVSLNNVVDENGKIKKGLEIFDLNNDGKLDDTEKKFFTGGGIPFASNDADLTIENFVTSLKQLDKFGYVDDAGGNIENKIITNSDKNLLYKDIAGAFYMLENMKDFPPKTQQKFINALNNIHFVEHHTKYSTGAQSDGKISVAVKNMNNDEIASVLIHELTHYILTETTEMNPLMQEVETFYMEYKLYQQLSKKSDFIKKNNVSNNIIFSNMNYIRTVDELKEKYPNLDEKEIAVTAFLKTLYQSYNGRIWYDKMSESELKNAKYDNLGGILDMK